MTDTMRPIMTRAELHGHKVTSHGRDYNKSDDGWSDMEVAAVDDWHPVSGWGRDGWDLGEWPYVVISVRGDREMCQTVEGDTDVYRFDNKADRDAAIDYLFVWYGIGKEYEEWEVEGLGPRWNEGTSRYETREALDAGTLRVTERMRGPFSWARLDRETADA